MSKEILMTKPEKREYVLGSNSFGLRISSFLRHSSLDIRHSPPESCLDPPAAPGILCTRKYVRRGCADVVPISLIPSGSIMELEEALARVSEIRLQIAQTEPFRGYRSATAAFSSLIALGAAAVQPMVLPDPAPVPQRYA